MEELLTQLKNALNDEKSSSTTDIESRKQAHASYIQMLDTVMARLRVVESTYRTEVASLISESSAEQKKLNDLIDWNSKEKATHQAKLEELTKRIIALDKDINDREEAHLILDKKIDGLTREFKITESNLSTVRGNVSLLERAVRSLTEDQKKLTASITEKKKEDSDLTVSIEQKKTEFTRLSGEVSILEARTKK